MNKKSAVLFIFIILFLSQFAQTGEMGGNQISDEKTRLTIAEALSWQKGKEEEALLHYREILKNRPQDPDILRKTGNLLLRLNKIEEAEKLLLSAYQINPELPGLRTDLAMLEIRRGHASRAYSLFDDAKALQRSQEEQLLFADGMQLWGDFYRAEKIYRDILSRDENDTNNILRLAKVLEAMQRYEEAEGKFLCLLRNQMVKNEALAGLIRIKLKEKDYGAVERFKKQLSENKRSSFHIAPEPAALHKMYNQLKKLAENGKNEDAVNLCRQILQNDKEHFPARFDLALLLAEDRKYDESIQILDKIAEEFGNPSRVLLEKARVLSWARRYEESLSLYDALHKINPSDPVPLKEKARVAAWAKEMALAQVNYHRILTPSVNDLLLGFLQEIRTGQQTGHDVPIIDKMLVQLHKETNDLSCWKGYEKLLKEWPNFSSTLSVENRTAIQQVFDKLYGKYLLQRNIEMEARAKKLAWDKRYAEAFNVYSDIIAVNPGNQEALFDMGQIAYALGLNDEAMQSYKKLLELSPRHTEARIAQQMQQLRGQPQEILEFTYWKEKGRGELAAIQRYHELLKTEIPFSSNHLLEISYHRWEDNPAGAGNSEDANGFSIEWEGELSPYLKMDAGWIHKDYAGGVLDDMDFGYAGITVNLHDRLHIGMDYERREEITNNFALQQGSYSDNLNFTFDAPLTRRWDISAKITTGEYFDHNRKNRSYLESSYIISEHPHELKFTIYGEYRDTEHKNEYYYNGKTLLDIEHPYWTPENYSSGGASVEWRHDLSRFQFREAEQHYYSLRLAGGNDSDNNSFLQVNAFWHVEFKSRWTIEAGGFIHRSREWDANGARALIGVRF